MPEDRVAEHLLNLETETGGSVQLVRRILGQARPYWPHLGLILLLGLLAAPLSLLMPVPLKIAVDSVLGDHPVPGFIDAVVPDGWLASNEGILFVAVGLLLAITFLQYAQGLVLWILQSYTGEKLVIDFRARIFRHAQRLSLRFHDEKGSSDSLYRIQYDTTSIQSITTGAGVSLITAFATVISMVVVTAMIDLELALVALVVCPVLFVLVHRFAGRLRKGWLRVKKLDSTAMGVVQEVLGAIRIVKAFGQEDQEQDRFVRTSEDRVRKQVRVAAMQGGFDLLTGMTTAAGTAIVLLLGVRHVQSGVLTLGELLIVMAYLAQIYQPLRMISANLASVQLGIAGAMRAMTILDTVPEVEEKPHARPLKRARGEFEVAGVSFQYEDGRDVLSDVSFHVAPGTRVGIKGKTGAGKTTLINLLMRFYDPHTGYIRLDGTDLRDYRLVDLRNQFAIVHQEPVLFSTTIGENIAYGRPSASKEQLIEAARLANVHDFIASLPNGYETEVGERGVRLSGGERQRISLARAFLKNAPVLLLDEPTSSVDVKTEAAIMEATERLLEGRTSFIIAHRLSTLDNCDVILHLEAGRLVEAARPVGSLAP